MEYLPDLPSSDIDARQQIGPERVCIGADRTINPREQRELQLHGRTEDHLSPIPRYTKRIVWDNGEVEDITYYVP